MKKFYLAFTLILGFMIIQNRSSAQFFGGFRLGFNSSRLILGTEEGKVETDEMKSLAGFNVGLIFDYTFENGFAIESGIIGNTRGSKSEMELEVGTVKSKTTGKLALFHFDVPLNAMYKLDLDPLTLFAQAGPYMSFGIAGVNHTKVVVDGETQTDEAEKVEFGTGPEASIKRGDYGVQFGGGVQISSFLIGIYYQMGMANVLPMEDPGDAYMKHRVLQVSIGAKLGDKR